jgi:hypothetical protein
MWHNSIPFKSYFLSNIIQLNKTASTYVLDRFQSSSEKVNDYIIAVVAAAEVLGYEGPESRLVHRMVQNLHPQVKVHLMFCTKPESVQDLFALVTTVAEAMAVEEQRKPQPSTARREGPPTPRGSRTSMVVAESSPAGGNRRSKCWGCGEWGHLQSGCPAARGNRDSGVSGNARGAQE